IETELSGTHRGRIQRIYTGSYAVIQHEDALPLDDEVTFVTMVNPTRLASGTQAIMSKWHEPTKAGFGVYVNNDAKIEVRLGDGEGRVSTYATDKDLIEGQWYLVAGTYRNGSVQVYQIPFVTRTNSRFAIASSFDS